MESNEGKCVSDVKTVYKLIESVPVSSTRVPGLRKQQNCPSVSVTRLVSAPWVPVTPGALRSGALLRESSPALWARLSLQLSGASSGHRERFLRFQTRRAGFPVLQRGPPPSLLPRAVP